MRRSWAPTLWRSYLDIFASDRCMCGRSSRGTSDHEDQHATYTASGTTLTFFLVNQMGQVTGYTYQR
jgi:hypothetical protein